MIRLFQALAVILILSFPAAGLSASDRHPRSILLIHSFEPLLPYSSIVNQSVQASIRSGMAGPVIFYTEYLDLARFTHKAYIRSLHELLRRKYEGKHLDLVIVFLDPALDFIQKHGGRISTSTPIVFCTVERRQIEQYALSPRITGVLMETDPKGTLDAALRLQPDTRQVFVIAGTHNNDRAYENAVRKAFARYEGRIAFTYLHDLSLEEILEKVRHLPDHSIIFFITLFRDGAGKAHIPQVVASQISQSANVPMYGLFETYLGYGIVGGHLVSFEQQGKNAAELGIRILEGESPAHIPIQVGQNVYLYDWRQMQRWGIGKAELPADSIIRYQKPSIWDLYRWEIVGITVFVLLESLLIVILIIQHRRRCKAEELLRISEERHRRIVSTANEGIWTMDTGHVTTFVNTKMADMMGYTPEEMTGRSIGTFVCPDDLEGYTAKLEELRNGASQVHECCLCRKDGTALWTIVSAAPLTDGTGAFLGSFAMFTDITERRQMEETIQESRRQLSDIIAFLPDATLVIDHNGKVIAWNRAMENLTGSKAEDMLGKGDYEYALPFYGKRRPVLIDLALHPDPELEKTYTAIQRTGDVLFGESYTPQLPPGNIHMSGTASVLRNSRGEIVGAIECMRNSTERRALEERLQRSEKMESLGLLAGGVAHDLNNVLGILVGYSEMILDRVDRLDPIRDHVQYIMRGGEMAAAIVQDLLTMARRGVNTEQVVNLNTIVADFQKMPEYERLRSTHPRIRIETRLEKDLMNIMGSPVHLGKTLMNLVANSAEAIRSIGVVTITTANRYLDRPIRGYDNVREGNYVVLTVADTGEGISPADMKHIFEPFYTKKVMGRSGTGLGLAVVWGTAKDHNGYIDVQSEEGKGTIFTLYFPVTAAELAVASSPVPVSDYLGKGETILIVDDVEGQRELAAGMLTKLNYRVAKAASGEEAVDFLKADEVDLVVLDMIMDPGMDGLDTYIKILEIHPGQKAILVSGFSETDRVSKAYTLGAGAYVKKPFTLERLGTAVRKELDRK